MEEKEVKNIYAIPANYTDSGKLLGGMIEPRNAVETAILLILVGYPELMWIPMPGTIRIVVMVVTLMPLAVLSVMGLAVTLAIQGTLSNLAGGIQVLTAKPFKADDYIAMN